MNFRDRINELLKELHISRAEFERICGLSNGYTRNLGKTPGAEKLEQILKAFPRINRNWLLTGEGEMFIGTITQSNNIAANINGDNHVNNADLSDTLNRAFDEIAAQRKLTEKAQAQIDELLEIIKMTVTNKQ